MFVEPVGSIVYKSGFRYEKKRRRERRDLWRVPKFMCLDGATLLSMLIIMWGCNGKDVVMLMRFLRTCEYMSVVSRGWWETWWKAPLTSMKVTLGNLPLVCSHPKYKRKSKITCSALLPLHHLYCIQLNTENSISRARIIFFLKFTIA